MFYWILLIEGYNNNYYTIDAGINLKAVSSRLGHSRPGITRDLYAHAVEAADRRAADALNELIKKGASGNIGNKVVTKQSAKRN